MKSLCYADRLKYLGLSSLENRRIRSDLIETYKIINGYYNIDASLVFFNFDEGGRRGHSKKLYKRRSRLDTRKYVFANRITDLWNSLPDVCVNSTTLNQFKSHISKILEPEVRSLICLYSLCLLLPPLSFCSGGFGKFGKTETERQCVNEGKEGVFY